MIPVIFYLFVYYFATVIIVGNLSFQTVYCACNCLIHWIQYVVVGEGGGGGGGGVMEEKGVSGGGWCTSFLVCKG